MPLPEKTSADRLHALIARLHPPAAAQYAADGSWINRHPDPGVAPQRHPNGEPVIGEDGRPIPDRDAAGKTKPARHSGAPYTIETLPDGVRRVSVVSKDGDVIAGLGRTVAEAITAIEEKLPPR